MVGTSAIPSGSSRLERWRDRRIGGADTFARARLLFRHLSFGGNAGHIRMVREAGEEEQVCIFQSEKRTAICIVGRDGGIHHDRSRIRSGPPCTIQHIRADSAEYFSSAVAIGKQFARALG